MNDLKNGGNKREMSKEERRRVAFEISEIMRNAVSDEYSKYILEQEDSSGNTLLEDIIKNVMETSAWKDEGYYNSSDIKLAIGRELMVRLGIEY